ncbi:hypothetical protein ACFL2D_00275 [Patescibacteria group bacterium]
MKKIFISIISLAVFALLPFATQAADNSVDMYFFWGDGCPHCAHEEEFIETIKGQEGLEIHEYEVWKNKDNQKFLLEVSKTLETEASGVPVTIIGDELIIGFHDAESTGKKIQERIDFCRENDCPDSVGVIVGTHKKAIEGNLPEPEPEELADGETAKQEEDNEAIPESIAVPIFGEIKTANVSLPVLTIILGALDGFNPCAMWSLLFLITLLVGMKNKRRMWVLGSAFIVTSALVYFLFMAAWLNVFLLLGVILWVRLIIGFVAIAGGSYNLREYWKNKDGTCKVTRSKQRQKTFEKLKAITQKKSFWIALGGIILLAGAVNMVELICSAGLPAVYTQVLSLSDLATWQYYGYLALYVFVFMLDDLIIFFAAMITLQVTGLTTKYTRFSHLIGGILMVLIGLILIFRPEWLMFG